MQEGVETNMGKRIFVISMVDSIHSARWLAQFQDSGHEFLLFPSSPHRRIHPKLKELLNSNSSSSYRIVPFGRIFGLPFWIADKFLGNAIRGFLARRFIRGFRPDIVHALELQNAGYIALKALENRKPAGLKLITTNWGSDIFWFQRFPKHKMKLKRLLDLSDFHSAECVRDLALASQLGFKGKFMPVIPNAGGFSNQDLFRDLEPAANRMKIAIKGYHGWVGRAKTALRAVAELGENLSGLEFVVYSANATTKKEAKRLEKEFGCEFQVFDKGALSHQQVLELFASSRIYIGLSESDGISTSLLEAMAMGAIPVQTATACCDEWFQDTGVAVRSIDVESVKNSILKALELANDPSNSQRNLETIRQKASADNVSEIARTFYKI